MTPEQADQIAKQLEEMVTIIQWGGYFCIFVVFVLIATAVLEQWRSR